MTRRSSDQPSENVANLRESATIAVSARAKALKAAGRAVIDLGAGEPDFPTPSFVMQAAHAALDTGATRYTQVEGILPLRERIAARASLVHGAPITADNIVVTAVCPGAFASDMNRAARDQADAVAKAIPAKRIGTDEDMAGIAIYLASRAGDYVVGNAIAVDGGIVYAHLSVPVSGE